MSDKPEFTDEQVQQFYRALMAQDPAFMTQFVKVAIKSSAEVMVDMFNDSDRDTIPSAEDVRQYAKDVTHDIVKDFNILTQGIFNKIPFKGNVKTKTEITIELKFD